MKWKFAIFCFWLIYVVDKTRTHPEALKTSSFCIQTDQVAQVEVTTQCNSSELSFNELNDSTEDFSQANSSLTSSTSKDGDALTKNVEFLKGELKEVPAQLNKSLKVNVVEYYFV